MCPEVVKLPEENVREKLPHICLRNYFLDMLPKTQARKAKIDMWDSKTKLLHSKGNNQLSE